MTASSVTLLPATSSSDDPTAALVREALVADGVFDSTVSDAVADIAARLGVDPDPLAVAASAWAQVSDRPPGLCGLYALVEVVELVARGDLSASSPPAQLVARCFDLVSCEKPPSLPRVTSASAYGRRAAAELGARRPAPDTPALTQAHILASRVGPFVAALTA